MLYDSEMTPTPMRPILQRLEDELFFAILDVVLYIEAELIVGNTQPIFIPLRRIVVRYEQLYPGHSVGTSGFEEIRTRSKLVEETRV